MYTPPINHRARQLYLVIGSAKTGSSAIQATLANNRNLLSQRKILYPTSLGARSHSLISICIGSLWDYGNQHRAQGLKRFWGVLQTRRDVFEMLAREINETKPETIIVSYEGLFNIHSKRASITRLKKFADSIAENTTIVVFLRRQDEVLLSHFVHSRRLGGSKELVIPEILRDWSHLDYFQTLKYWSEQFGIENILARPFRLEHFPNGDVVHYFFRLLKINMDGYEIPGAVNIGLDALQEEFLQRINELIPRFNEKSLNKLRRGLDDALYSTRKGRKKRQLSYRERKYILDYFSNSNSELEKTYGQNNGFFAPLAKTDQDQNIPGLAVADSIEIAAELWKWSIRRILIHQKQESDLRSRISELERRLQG
jgi:hypothetical protein